MVVPTTGSRVASYWVSNGRDQTHFNYVAAFASRAAGSFSPVGADVLLLRQIELWVIDDAALDRFLLQHERNAGNHVSGKARHRAGVGTAFAGRSSGGKRCSPARLARLRGLSHLSRPLSPGSPAHLAPVVCLLAVFFRLGVCLEAHPWAVATHEFVVRDE